MNGRIFLKIKSESFVQFKWITLGNLKAENCGGLIQKHLNIVAGLDNEPQWDETRKGMKSRKWKRNWTNNEIENAIKSEARGTNEKKERLVVEWLVNEN